uniref:Uncharacterized protein n=1 Tax=Pectobacterium carotovorum TaxID=554 RepID=A0A0N9NDN2_PECCA|nr:Hypothetical protein [Pectobacterium carotovorum]
MTHTVTIAIVDPDRYFALGLEALLRHYFSLRDVQALFYQGQPTTRPPCCFKAAVPTAACSSVSTVAPSTDNGLS